MKLIKLPQSKIMQRMFRGKVCNGMYCRLLKDQPRSKKKKKRKLQVSDARKVLTQQEAHKLVDMAEAAQEAIERSEQSGIIFIDEIDKVAAKQDNAANVSREGVQRDVLPIVEGSTEIKEEKET